MHCVAREVCVGATAKHVYESLNLQKEIVQANMSRGVQGWSWKHAPSLRTVDNCLSNCRTYCATVSSLSQFNSGRLSGYWYKGVLGRLGLAAVQPAASPPQQQQRSLMAHFLVRHRTSTLGTRGTRSRPAVRAVLHTSAPIEKQQLWQQAVLAAMLQQHATDTAERSAYSSCAELDAQLDSVFDGLDDIFYSKVIQLQLQRIIDQAQLPWGVVDVGACANFLQLAMFATRLTPRCLPAGGVCHPQARAAAD